MLGLLDHVTRQLIVHASSHQAQQRLRGPSPEQLDDLYGPKPGRPTKPVVLVEDNGPIHLSKLSLAALAARQHWLTVEWLPKYAPELNDIEVVWRDLKAHHLAHQTFTDVDALDQAVHAAVQQLNRERMAVPLANPRIPALGATWCKEEILMRAGTRLSRSHWPHRLGEWTQAMAAVRIWLRRFSAGVAALRSTQRETRDSSLQGVGKAMRAGKMFSCCCYAESPFENRLKGCFDRDSSFGMWTPATRGRMGKIEKKTKRYPSDLTNEEWAKIEPFLPRGSKSGRPIEVDLQGSVERNPLHGAFGRGWRMLPNDFPPWQTVYWWFRRFVRQFMFQTDPRCRADMLDRERVGREASFQPAASSTANRSKLRKLKQGDTTRARRSRGRKRHIAVDTDGQLLMINLTPADISDSAGAQMILDGVRKRWPWLKHLSSADGAYDRTQLMDYDRTQLMDKAAFRDFTIQIVKRSDTAKGFEVLPRRGVVERTFGWTTRWRRLVRDYEERIDRSEAMIHVALASLLLRRITHE